MKYDYELYYRDLKNLYYNIKKSQIQYDLIVGIQRGGLVAAVHLSNILNVPMQTLHWSKYGNVRDSNNPHLISNKGKKILLVDDILDDGDTLNEIYKEYYPMDTAVLVYNRENKFGIVPKYSGWIINRSEYPEWINYWWEQE